MMHRNSLKHLNKVRKGECLDMSSDLDLFRTCSRKPNKSLNPYFYFKLQQKVSDKLKMCILFNYMIIYYLLNIIKIKNKEIRKHKYSIKESVKLQIKPFSFLLSQ